MAASQNFYGLKRSPAIQLSWKEVCLGGTKTPGQNSMSDLDSLPQSACQTGQEKKIYSWTPLQSENKPANSHPILYSHTSTCIQIKAHVHRQRGREINVTCSIRSWCSGFAVGRLFTETDSSEPQCSGPDGCHLYLKAEPILGL